MKIKFLLPALVLSVISTRAYSQSKNSISLFYGLSATHVSINDALTDHGYRSKTGTAIGLGFTHNLTESFALESGLQYSNNNLIRDVIIPDRGVIPFNGTAKLITIPVYGKYTFLKYFYVNAGLLVDFDFGSDNDTEINDQKGVGTEVGVGAKYSFDHLSIFINPFFQEHRLIGFKNYGEKDRLENAGVKLGVAYNF